MTHNAPPFTGSTWPVDVAGFDLDLPIVAIKPDFAISLMMIIDLGVRFGAHVGEKLAEKLAPLKPEIVEKGIDFIKNPPPK